MRTTENPEITLFYNSTKGKVHPVNQMYTITVVVSRPADE